MYGKSIIWSSDSIEQNLEKMRFGMPINTECFYQGDVELKNGNILFQLTPEEVKEYEKCSEDVVYFVEKYCRFLTDKGRMTVDLRDYQEDILRDMGEEEWIEDLKDFGPKNRNMILLQSRQTGKTTTVAAFFAWYLCFHTDRNLAILANKQATATEIVSKVTDVFKGLPFFLKPGIIQAGALGMRLDNGCMLASQATTKTAQIGFTIHVLYIDEFAHIQNNIARSFWRSVYPTLSSSDVSQCIISSTPNGTDNLFYELIDKSQKGDNSFLIHTVYYWQVPGHDEEWAEKMKRDFGEEEFAQEFELQFDVGSNLLLRASDLRRIKLMKKKFVPIDLQKTDLDPELYQNHLLWHSRFDPNASFNEQMDRFIITVDIAEGKDEDEKKDSDYNILHINKVYLKSLASLRRLRKDERKIENMFRFYQVGLYRDNIKDEDVLAKVCKAIVFDQFGEEITRVGVEMNFNGKAFLKEFMDHDLFYSGVLLHTHHTKPIPGQKAPKKKPGFKTTSNKSFYCKLGQKLISKGTIVPTEEETYNELKSFGKDKKGNYKGLGRHDDAAFSTLNISRFYDEDPFKDWLYDFFERLPDSPEKRYITELFKEPTDNSDVEDGMFNAMYGLDDVASEVDVFKQGEMSRGRYVPGYSGM